MRDSEVCFYIIHGQVIFTQPFLRGNEFGIGAMLIGLAFLFTAINQLIIQGIYGTSNTIAVRCDQIVIGQSSCNGCANAILASTIMRELSIEFGGVMLLRNHIEKNFMRNASSIILDDKLLRFLHKGEEDGISRRNWD